MKKIFSGARIEEFIQVEDYWRMNTNQMIANLYNPIKMEKDGREIMAADILKENIIAHLIIDEFFLPKERYDILLDNDVKISMSLLEKDYVGPEAMSIVFFSGKIMVIN